MSPGEEAARRALDFLSSPRAAREQEEAQAEIADAMLDAANWMMQMAGPTDVWRRLMAAHRLLCSSFSPRASGSTEPKGRSGAGHSGPSGTSGAREEG